jgi:hypothetical protein
VNSKYLLKHIIGGLIKHAPLIYPKFLFLQVPSFWELALLYTYDSKICWSGVLGTLEILPPNQDGRPYWHAAILDKNAAVADPVAHPISIKCAVLCK